MVDLVRFLCRAYIENAARIGHGPQWLKSKAKLQNQVQYIKKKKQKIYN